MNQSATSSLTKVIAALDTAGITFNQNYGTARVTDTKAQTEYPRYGRAHKPLIEVEVITISFTTTSYSGGGATLYFVKDTGAYLQKKSTGSYPFSSQSPLKDLLVAIEKNGPKAIEEGKAKIAAQDAERAAAYDIEVAEAHAEAQRERLVAQGVLFEALKAEGLNDAQASAVVIMVQAQEANPVTELIAAAHKATRRAQGYLDDGRYAPPGRSYKDGKPVVTV